MLRDFDVSQEHRRKAAAEFLERCAGADRRVVTDGGQLVASETYYVVSNSSTDKTCYHVDDDCDHLVGASYRERSPRYIEFHELRPCSRCGGDDDE